MDQVVHRKVSNSEVSHSSKRVLSGGRMVRINAKKWKLRLNPDHEPILPPAGLKTVRTIATGGPNAQVIEHCLFAPSVSELVRRAPQFHVLIPIQMKGENRPWPIHSFGLHMNVVLPLAVTIVVRVNDDQYSIFGPPCGECFPPVGAAGDLTTNSMNSELVWIINYSQHERRGEVQMYRERYIEIIEAWTLNKLDTV